MELFSTFVEFIENYISKNPEEVKFITATIYPTITIVIVVFSAIYGVSRLIKKLIKGYFDRRNYRLLSKDLRNYSFSQSDVEKATNFYIPTKYQNVSPSNDEEPSSMYIASAKEKLIPLFLDKVFSHNGNANKYYLILADAGMGKTTFMINLYLAYKNKAKRFWQPEKKDIVIYSLGDSKALEKLKAVDNKRNTILLLDAFDEDINAIDDYKRRLNEILRAVVDFHDIVLTSRTQFFPSEIEEPYKTGYISFGDSNESRNFQKLYLAVFDNSDVKKYIRKRIPVFKIKKRYNARKIVKKSPSLVVRPMLLSHIEDLVNSKMQFQYTYQVYQVLIDRWTEREALKPGVEGRYGKDKYQKMLHEFSQEIAINMYENNEKRSGYFVTKDDGFGKEIYDYFEELESQSLSETERRSKSLLNRDADGKYKFSHKSIMEYFLAKKMVTDGMFARNFNFQGNSVTMRFYKEMLSNEILTPLNSEINEQVNKKQKEKYSIPAISLSNKMDLIHLAASYFKMYQNLTDSIYKCGIQLRNGLDQFNYLYKVEIYNSLMDDLKSVFKSFSVDEFKLLFRIDSELHDQITSELDSLKMIYFEDIISSKLKPWIGHNDIYFPMNHDSILNDHLSNKRLKITEMFKVLMSSKNPNQLIYDISILNTILNDQVNATSKIKLRHLIALTFELYTMRYSKSGINNFELISNSMIKAMFNMLVRAN